MPRWIGVTTDPNSSVGGSTLDLLANPGPVDFPVPDVFLRATTAQSDRGHMNSENNEEVNGVRGSAPPDPYRSAPQLNFTVPLYHPMATLLMPAVFGKVGTPVGVAPAAIKTPLGPVAYGAMLPSLVIWILREHQIDKHAGIWIEQVVLDALSASKPTLAVTARSLYHESQPITDPEDLPDATYLDSKDFYASVTFKAATGPGAGTPIRCMTTFTATFSNNFETDEDIIFCPGENVLTKLVAGAYRRRQYPGMHVVGEQTLTGTVGFGTTRVEMEDRALLATAERLVVQMTGNPLGTTPPADALFEMAIPNWVITGGDGASELTRTGPIKSSYEWGGFVGDDGSDVTVSIVDTAPVTLPA